MNQDLSEFLPVLINCMQSVEVIQEMSAMKQNITEAGILIKHVIFYCKEAITLIERSTYEIIIALWKRI